MHRRYDLSLSLCLNLSPFERSHVVLFGIRDILALKETEIKLYYSVQRVTIVDRLAQVFNAFENCPFVVNNLAFSQWKPPVKD